MTTIYDVRNTIQSLLQDEPEKKHRLTTGDVMYLRGVVKNIEEIDKRTSFEARKAAAINAVQELLVAHDAYFRRWYDAQGAGIVVPGNEVHELFREAYKQMLATQASAKKINPDPFPADENDAAIYPGTKPEKPAASVGVRWEEPKFGLGYTSIGG